MKKKKSQVRKDVTGKRIVYIDMDDTICDFSSLYKQGLENEPERQVPHSRVGYFLDLQPIENAIETIKWMDQQDQLAVFILTAPSIKNAHCYTEKRLWVERYLGMGMVGRLIISDYKNLSIGDFLIDDNCTGKGQEQFKGRHLHFGTKDCPDWLYVRNLFESFIYDKNKSS